LIPGWEENIRENFRLHKGKIFPARKSLVSDIPAGTLERDWDFFNGVGYIHIVYAQNQQQKQLQ
jgi:hypothetical protein